MTRSRLAVASLSAAALGIAAVLVPTASIAEPITETPAASAQVIWADAADEFSEISLSGAEFTLLDAWQWAAAETSTGSTLADYGTFGENGFTVNESSAVALLHGLPAPIAGADLADFVADSATNAGPEVLTGILVAKTSESTPEASQAASIWTVDGFHGEDTLWQAGEGGISTDELATDLSAGGVSVIGYIVLFPGPLPTVVPVPEDDSASENEPQPELLRSNGLLDDTQTLDELFAAQSGGAALRAAAVPDAAGIASFRIGDLTTYFTPQPTAALALSSASITVSQATTTGFTVSGSGFAPGEIVSSGIGTGAMGDSLPDTFIADADGNVSGTIVLPAAWAAAGDYFIVLVGESSGQVASSALAITGAAPVAVPVPGEATYTG